MVELPLLYYLNNNYYLYNIISGKKFALNSIPFVSSIYMLTQTLPEINNYTYFNGLTHLHLYMFTYSELTFSSKHKTIIPTLTTKYTYLSSQTHTYLHFIIQSVQTASSKLKSITLYYVIINNQTLTPLTNSYNINLQVFLTKIAPLTLHNDFSFDFLFYESSFYE